MNPTMLAVLLLWPILGVSFIPFPMEPPRGVQVRFITPAFNPFIYLLNLTHYSQNNIFRYGEFCGPGPDESFWGVLKPVDDIDGLCQRHDQAYRMCLDVLSSQIGFDAPKFLHQIMPIRGLFPQIVRNFVFSIVPQYLNCMHHADNDFVAALDDHITSGLLPIWWSDPNQAPIGAQGVDGYQEACSLGVPWAGMCIVPSKLLFQVALELFRTSVQGDGIVLTAAAAAGAQ